MAEYAWVAENAFDAEQAEYSSNMKGTVLILNSRVETPMMLVLLLEVSYINRTYPKNKEIVLNKRWGSNKNERV